MKKILFFLIVLILVGTSKPLSAQGPASCPIITSFQVVTSGPGLWKIKFDYQNATSGNKWVKVVATCNGNPITITPNCFDVPKDQTVTSPYESDVFACPLLADLTVFVESWVGNNCGGNLCTRQISIGGSPLPVDFKTFTATRNKSNVMLKWTTSTEKNNNGFAVERNIDNANWEEVGFVRSNAIGGNSNLDLDYQFIDNNNTKGITQYRIKQVDIDSRFKYTEVRSVKGDGQIGEIIVYPNPSTDGRINVVFDNATVVRNIMVIDMSGRTIKQINSVSNNNITIDNLMPGMYSLRVLVPETGEQTVKKIVVNKR